MVSDDVRRAAMTIDAPRFPPVQGFTRRTNSERNVLVFDLGGGIFDVSLLTI